MVFEIRSEYGPWESLLRTVLRPLEYRLSRAASLPAIRFWSAALTEATGYVIASSAPFSERYPLDESHRWVERAGDLLQMSNEFSVGLDREPWRPDEVAALQADLEIAESFGIKVLKGWPGLPLNEFEIRTLTHDAAYASFLEQLLFSDEDSWGDASAEATRQITAVLSSRERPYYSYEVELFVDGLFKLMRSLEANASIATVPSDFPDMGFAPDPWALQAWRLSRDGLSRERSLTLAHDVGVAFAETRIQDVDTSAWTDLRGVVEKRLNEISV